MVGQQVIWHGTKQESDDLLAAIERNCACQYNETQMRVASCPGHTALLTDQHWLDGLLCERRRCQEIKAQEWR